MKPLQPQIGISQVADFEENTWTFEMGEDFEVIAGQFAIVPLGLFENMQSNLRKFMLSEKINQSEGTYLDSNSVIKE
jgi:hypothetical protein